MVDISSRVVASLLVVLLLGAGWLRVRLRLASCSKDQKFAQEFLEKLHAFMASKGNDAIVYSWLTQRSARMQEELGPYGFLDGFSKPFENVIYRGVAVLFTVLPELYTELNTAGFAGGNTLAIAKYQQILQEVLTRHLGVLEDNYQHLRSELRNPFVWFREGVRSVVFLPVILLEWFGVVSASKVRRIVVSRLATIATSVLALLSLVSAVVTISIGWKQFLAVLRALIR